MKKYEKPGLTLMRLLQEERIAANFHWVWNGDGPDATQVEKQYLQYLEDHFGTLARWECGFDVVS